jgi:hypothetical protein
MQCPGCNGPGCDECRQSGACQIDCCPLEYIGWDTWELLDYAILYEKGLPPIAGGAMDQTAYFIAAARWIFEEMQYWKRKLGILDG